MQYQSTSNIGAITLFIYSHFYCLAIAQFKAFSSISAKFTRLLQRKVGRTLKSTDRFKQIHQRFQIKKNKIKSKKTL
jgi:hypothetical protein